MASAIKSALPTHLMPNSGDEQGKERRHGKTRSHMVSQETMSNSSIIVSSKLRMHMDMDMDFEGVKLKLRQP
jgi:hypothetical protein